MNLIPPSSQCPQTACYEVVQICWADGNGKVAGCSAVPAEAFFSKGATVSLDDVIQISSALALMMALAWLFRFLANFLYFQGR